MNGIIIYHGKYGATEQYAQWLSESLRMPMLSAKAARQSIIADYDIVILGSSVYVGRLVIHRWLKRNLSLLKNKKLFLFIVCGTSSDNSFQQQAIINNNVDPAIRGNCEIFFLQGRCIVSKLSWVDHFILKIGAMREKDPKKRANMTKGFDSMDKKNLKSLIGHISQLLKLETSLT